MEQKLTFTRIPKSQRCLHCPADDTSAQQQKQRVLHAGKHVRRSEQKPYRRSASPWPTIHPSHPGPRFSEIRMARCQRARVVCRILRHSDIPNHRRSDFVCGRAHRDLGNVLRRNPCEISFATGPSPENVSPCSEIVFWYLRETCSNVQKFGPLVHSIPLGQIPCGPGHPTGRLSRPGEGFSKNGNRRQENSEAKLAKERVSCHLHFRRWRRLHKQSITSPFQQEY